MLKKVLNASTSKEIKDLLDLIEEKYEVEWVPIGGRESNASTIQMLQNGENGIIERLTNAIDAVIEKEYFLNPDPSLESPRKATEKYFGIKNGDLTVVDDSYKELKDLITLTVSESGRPGKPTIEVRDKGIGLNADEFGSTILSLQSGNKINKHYLAGTFGQGGSTANNFAQHTLYISKGIKEKNPENKIAFTFTRVYDDINMYKTVVHQYLVDKKTGLPITVIDDENLFEPGTLVKHIEMDIGSYGRSSAIAPGSNSILFFVENTLFNPILPISLIENRTQVAKTVIERNNNTRPLRGFNVKLNATDKVVDSGTCIRQYSYGGTVKVNYWIVDKAEDYKNFNVKNSPILYTINGQVQSVQSNKILTNVGMPYLMDHIIVNVDLDGMADGYKTRLFTSDRTRFVNLDYTSALKKLVEDVLESDDKLVEYNKIYHDRLLNNSIDDMSDELNRKIENKLKVFVASGGIGKLVNKKKKHHGHKPIINEALEEAPTFIEITNQDPSEVEIGKSLSLNYISDVDYTKYDLESNLRLEISNEDKITSTGYKFYKNGHGLIVIDFSTDTKIGDEFYFKLYLKGHESDEDLSSDILVKIVEKQTEKEPSKDPTGENALPKINTFALTEDSENYVEIFGDDTDKTVELRDNKESIDIYINMEVNPIQKLVENAKIKEDDAESVTILKNEYVKQLAFYRLLLHFEQKETEELQDNDDAINSECKRAAILISGMINDNLNIYINELGDKDESSGTDA